MARYLQKYVGTYRVLAEYDKHTNDFPRLEDDSLDPSFDDLYIPCGSKSKIYHIGGRNLQAYIPSIGRGHNIILKIYNDAIGETESRNYESIYKTLTDNGIIFDIEENNEEVLFKFKADNIDLISEIMKARTSGKGISPFAKSNLGKSKYDIPLEDLTVYKKLTSKIDKVDIRKYTDINNGFMDKIVKKTKGYTLSNLKADIRKTGLKTKEYFHSVGLWQEYIKHIEGELEWK